MLQRVAQQFVEAQRDRDGLGLGQAPVVQQRAALGGRRDDAALLALLDARDTRPRRANVTVLEQEPGRVLLELSAPANLYYFDGHFAVAPVLPGVVQLDWAILYGRQYFALGPVFRGVNALKFQHMIGADTPVHLELVQDAAKGSLNFRYFSAAGQHAGGRILFGA